MDCDWFVLSIEGLEKLVIDSAKVQKEGKNLILKVLLKKRSLHITKINYQNLQKESPNTLTFKKFVDLRSRA